MNCPKCEKEMLHNMTELRDGIMMEHYNCPLCNTKVKTNSNDNSKE